jgi:hypothetical protein
MFLWNSLADELSASCSGTSTTLDQKMIERRVNHEGLSFLTITLPSFGKDFQKSLDQGYVSRNLFQGFSWQAGLPRFLGGFLETVFNRSDGFLLDEPSIDAIFAVQQLTQLFSKILLDCSSERTSRAMDQFVQCERDVRDAHNMITPTMWDDFERVSGLLLSSLLSSVDSDVYHGRITPKHGPGSTAERTSSNQKYSSLLWTRRLDEVFPVMDNLVSSYSLFDEIEESCHIADPGSEIPVRVISVPKSLKTPRIIAIEPTPMQYMQQGILESIVRHLEKKTKRKHSLLHKMIGFSDQTPNQRLALQGSLDGSLATLDLSEASDRVSNQHVRHLLHRHPHLHGAVDATRSRKADVPGHGVIRLAKFASMGSALCFPMEAMVFLTVVFLGIESELGHNLTRKDIKILSDQVRVYGDDIIVPVDFASPVRDALHSFGFVVNSGKSFWTGRFRESCGKEYFAGQDVSPVKFRRMFPSSLGHVPELVSLVSFRNLLYEKGLWTTAFMLDDRIRKVLPYYPKIKAGSPGLGAYTFVPISGERYDRLLHRPLVRAYTISAQLPIDEIDGYAALLKFHLKRGVDPLELSSFRRAGRPSALRLKQKWVTPF